MSRISVDHSYSIAMSVPYFAVFVSKSYSYEENAQLFNFLIREQKICCNPWILERLSGVRYKEFCVCFESLMGKGRNCQSQRFSYLGLESQSSKSRDCLSDCWPSRKSPRDLPPMGRLWDCLGLQLESQSRDFWIFWKNMNLAVPEIFFPARFFPRLKISSDPSPIAHPG